MAVSLTQDEVIDGALFDAHTTHARLGSKSHHLAHDVFYLALPLSRLEALPRRLMAHNGRGVFALNDRDYGHGDTDLRSWIASAFASCGETLPEGEITLVTMPRIFGLGFNPVSFWFCQDREGGLRAVMAEVNNTFGERHCYLCRHADGRVIALEDELRAEKVFHVSPFMPVAGHYLFRFRLTDEKIAIRVDLHRDGDKVLTTTLNGRREALTTERLRHHLWRHPLQMLKVVGMIHLHALALFIKGNRFFRQPPPPAQFITPSH